MLIAFLVTCLSYMAYLTVSQMGILSSFVQSSVSFLCLLFCSFFSANSVVSLVFKNHLFGILYLDMLLAWCIENMQCFSEHTWPVSSCNVWFLYALSCQRIYITIAATKWYTGFCQTMASVVQLCIAIVVLQTENRWQSSSSQAGVQSQEWRWVGENEETAKATLYTAQPVRSSIAMRLGFCVLLLLLVFDKAVHWSSSSCLALCCLLWRVKVSSSAGFAARI